jgi:hypothetical protein
MFTARDIAILTEGALGGGGTVFTVETATPKSVTDASGVILAANPLRTYALIINLVGEYVWLGLGHDAVENGGILLTTIGSNYEITLVNLFRGAIYAVRNAGKTGNVLVLEGV